MKQEIKDYECQYCHNHFITTRGGFSNHIRYCKDNPKSIKNRLDTSNKQKEYLLKIKNEQELTRKERILICKKCGKEYRLNLTDKEFNNHKYSDFCSINCARSYATINISNSFKKSKCIDCGKIIYIKKQASENNCRCDECKLIHAEPLKKCIVCGKEFRRHNATCCSEECSNEYWHNRKKYLSKECIEKLRITGKKSVLIQSENRRSKNEIEFCKLCEEYFHNVEHNKPIFNGWDADIIIHDIKYAILWNGKWHYEKITQSHSVKQVQNRDKIKIKEIENSGYTPYIIKDMGKYNLDFVKEEFNKFLIIIK